MRHKDGTCRGRSGESWSGEAKTVAPSGLREGGERTPRVSTPWLGLYTGRPLAAPRVGLWRIGWERVEERSETWGPRPTRLGAPDVWSRRPPPRRSGTGPSLTKSRPPQPHAVPPWRNLRELSGRGRDSGGRRRLSTPETKEVGGPAARGGGDSVH